MEIQIAMSHKKSPKKAVILKMILCEVDANKYIARDSNYQNMTDDYGVNAILKNFKKEFQLVEVLYNNIKEYEDMYNGRKREAQVDFFLSEKENRKLENLLSISKLTRSAFSRKCIYQLEIKIPPSREYRKLYEEINKIGTNVNQIARHCNQGADLRLLKDQLLFYMDELYTLLNNNI